MDEDDGPTLLQAMDNMIEAMRANKAVINRAKWYGISRRGVTADDLRQAIASIQAATAVLQGLLGE